MVAVSDQHGNYFAAPLSYFVCNTLQAMEPLIPEACGTNVNVTSPCAKNEQQSRSRVLSRKFFLKSQRMSHSAVCGFWHFWYISVEQD
jgi:hypothetical protein